MGFLQLEAGCISIQRAATELDAGASASLRRPNDERNNIDPERLPQAVRMGWYAFLTCATAARSPATAPRTTSSTASSFIRTCPSRRPPQVLAPLLVTVRPTWGQAALSGGFTVTLTGHPCMLPRCSTLVRQRQCHLSGDASEAKAGRTGHRRFPAAEQLSDEENEDPSSATAAGGAATAQDGSDASKGRAAATERLQNSMLIWRYQSEPCAAAVVADEAVDVVTAADFYSPAEGALISSPAAEQSGPEQPGVS